MSLGGFLSGVSQDISDCLSEKKLNYCFFPENKPPDLVESEKVRGEKEIEKEKIAVKKYPHVANIFRYVYYILLIFVAFYIYKKVSKNKKFFKR